VLYRECRNLWVTVLIHALWNSRVFFCSWLGI
jgi:membrane protease YdiL (CAAX protease family)